MSWEWCEYRKVGWEFDPRTAVKYGCSFLIIGFVIGLAATALVSDENGTEMSGWPTFLTGAGLGLTGVACSGVTVEQNNRATYAPVAGL